MVWLNNIDFDSHCINVLIEKVIDKSLLLCQKVLTHAEDLKWVLKEMLWNQFSINFSRVVGYTSKLIVEGVYFSILYMHWILSKHQFDDKNNININRQLSMLYFNWKWGIHRRKKWSGEYEHYSDKKRHVHHSFLLTQHTQVVR